MGYTVVHQVLPSAVRTASGVSNGFNLSEADELQILADVSAVSGTSPVLKIALEVSPDNVNWWNHSSFADITAVGKYRLATTNFGKYVRVSYDISGTTPSFTFGVWFVTKAVRR